MRQISVVIITFNEERNIGRCIDSVKNIADDIVVVDSFSTDQTRQICEQKGVRFVEHTFEGHIEQKNWAITQARYPFILSLDADEALSPELEKSILEAKNDSETDGYTMNRLTNYCGKWIWHSGWYPDRKLRLWDSTKGKWGGVNPHDRYELNDGSRIKHLKGDLFHYSFYSVEQHKQQAAKFSEIAAKAMLKSGKRSNSLKIIYKPVARFIRNYILKAGFLDGYYGFLICRISAKAVYMRYSKLKKMQQS